MSDTIDVPDEFVDCIGQFHGVTWLNLIHRAQNGCFDLRIIKRFAISLQIGRTTECGHARR